MIDFFVFNWADFYPFSATKMLVKSFNICERIFTIQMAIESWEWDQHKSTINTMYKMS